jgi:hypothetical protein
MNPIASMFIEDQKGSTAKLLVYEQESSFVNANGELADVPIEGYHAAPNIPLASL